jgi:hypothetical protein
VVKHLLEAGADASARLADRREVLALAVTARDAALAEVPAAAGTYGFVI